jgi:uncharacterized iron-regulated membrane protein
MLVGRWLETHAVHGIVCHSYSSSYMCFVIYQYAIQWSLRMGGQESTVVTLSRCSVWVSHCRSGTTSTPCQANIVLSVGRALLEYRQTCTSHLATKSVCRTSYIFMAAYLSLKLVVQRTYLHNILNKGR